LDACRCLPLRFSGLLPALVLYCLLYAPPARARGFHRSARVMGHSSPYPPPYQIGALPGSFLRFSGYHSAALPAGFYVVCCQIFVSAVRVCWVLSVLPLPPIVSVLPLPAWVVTVYLPFYLPATNTVFYRFTVFYRYLLILPFCCTCCLTISFTSSFVSAVPGCRSAVCRFCVLRLAFLPAVTVSPSPHLPLDYLPFLRFSCILVLGACRRFRVCSPFLCLSAICLLGVRSAFLPLRVSAVLFCVTVPFTVAAVVSFCVSAITVLPAVTCRFSFLPRRYRSCTVSRAVKHCRFTCRTCHRYHHLPPPATGSGVRFVLPPPLGGTSCLVTACLPPPASLRSTLRSGFILFLLDTTVPPPSLRSFTVCYLPFLRFTACVFWFTGSAACCLPALRAVSHLNLCRGLPAVLCLRLRGLPAPQLDFADFFCRGHTAALPACRLWLPAIYCLLPPRWFPSDRALLRCLPSCLCPLISSWFSAVLDSFLRSVTCRSPLRVSAGLPAVT